MIATLLAAAWIAAASPETNVKEYVKLEQEAERLYEKGSFEQSLGLYRQAETMTLSPERKRWVAFRVADTDWRSHAATQTADQSRFETSREALDALVRDAQRVEDRDRVWAEVHESLGDFWWTRRDARNWWQGWQHYEKALDWWAGAADVEVARKRYLGIVWRAVNPPDAEDWYYYGYYGNWLPVPILENVLQIATSPDDLAHAHYLLARGLEQQGNWENQARIPEELEAALAAGKGNDWYDDALFHYAEFLESHGRATATEDGGWTREQDYVAALALYERLLKEFKKGETRFFDDAKRRVAGIVEPTLGLSVSNVFLPDSEVQFHASWRNLKAIELELHAVDLATAVKLDDESADGFLSSIELTPTTRVKAWTHDTLDKGRHVPGSALLPLPMKLAPGAYVLEAKAGKKSARELVLVTDAAVLLKGAKKKVVVFAVEVDGGSPLVDADVVLWQRYYGNGDYLWQRTAGKTNAEGLATFDRPKTEDGSGNELFAVVRKNDRQAFSTGSAPYRRGAGDSWKLHAYTDRPAYRPGDTAQWKVIARRHDGAQYHTPKGRTLAYEIRDPRGSTLKEGSGKLNAFGTLWGTLELGADLPLGEFTVSFRIDGDHVGDATLFRVEEYKLPEFQVSVKTPEVDGRRKAFRLGEKVEATVEVEYYFGGPVADADVELQVFQSPYHPHWEPPREYPWFYEDLGRHHRGYYDDGGSIIRSERLKTDATGKATIVFETPRGAGQDFEYRIQAKVTDSSRREVVGSGSVRVTRQRVYVFAHAPHSIYKPQDKVAVELRAFDANHEPASVEGKVTVTRAHWYEIWIGPDGKEVRGKALETLMRTEKDFHARYRLKFRGYEHEEVLTRTVKTAANGKGELSFTPARDGYYRIAWSSRAKGEPEVRAETTVWVADRASNELGYRHGGLEILLDEDTVRPGATTPVLVTVPASDRWVLFTVEGEDLYDVRVLHMTGTVKLVEIAIEEKHVPNVFLGAMMASDRQLHAAEKQIVVPPVRHFLDVAVEPDREEYRAREKATFRVRTRDWQGKPVAAEVSLGVVDESVYYIQQDLAPDPRQFFFGEKRNREVTGASSFQWRSFVRLVPGGPSGGLQNEPDRDARREQPGAMPEPADPYAAEEEKMAEAQAPAADMATGSMKLGAVGGRKRARSEAAKDDESGGPPPGGPGGGGEGDGEPAVQVRTDFRATAFWGADVTTDADGVATVSLAYPDSLTAWRATARAAGTGAQFGIGTGTTRTRMPLIVRLQGPRFFVVGDVTTVSAVVNNNTNETLVVSPELVADGLTIKGSGAGKKTSIPAGGNARIDWTVLVERAGEARLRVVAKAGSHTDAMEKSFLVHEHGVEKLLVKSGKSKGASTTVSLTLPKERREGSTAMTVQVAPSLAVTMLDALPYLIDFPYGCTEQTMSRFLPAAIVARTLKELGVDPADAMERAFGGIEKEHAKKTQPGGRKSLAQLDEMVEQGLKRLYDFQHGDGGWGWWKEGESDRYMTAYVLWGLALARDGGISVREDAAERAASWLEKELVQEENDPDRTAWLLHALSAHHSKRGAPSAMEKKAFDRASAAHTRLSAYGRALLAISAKRYGFGEEAKQLVTNLANGASKDAKPDTSIVIQGEQEGGPHVQGTVHWGSDSMYRRWSDSGIESTAFAVAAMLAVDPSSPLLDPAVNWLVKNRRGAQWSNTKDTAIVVLALTDYLKKSGEIGAELEYRLTVNGKEIAKKKIAKGAPLAAPSRYVVDGKILKDGANEVKIERLAGTGPIYFSAQASFFSLEEPVKAAGNEIFVRRQYFKYVGRQTLLKGLVYDKVPLLDRATVASGERIEVVVTVEAKNDYEYLMFEDLKPAGFEAVEVKSGQPVHAKELKNRALQATLGEGGRGAATDGGDFTGRTRWVYQELRDRKVGLFLDRLPQGVWEIRYDLRAEVPGSFHALPVLGQAMYVPEIRCNGEELRVEVADRPGS